MPETPARPSKFLSNTKLLSGTLITGLVAAVAFAAPSATTPASSGPDFTSAQALKGQSDYTQNCAGCHGANLQGGAGPTLMGPGFLKKWANGQPLDNLYQVISKQMPLNAPGSLKPDQYLAITSYILSKNGYSPTSKPLNAAGLKVALKAPGGTASSAPADKGPAATNLPKVVKPYSGTPAMTGPTADELANPSANDWVMYNRDYQGQRYSTLKDITADNAGKLQPLCIAQLGETGPFQTSPVIYQGTIYVTTPRNTYALNATTCQTKWSASYTPTGAEPFPNNRGVALYAGMLFRGTGDGHLIALDAKTGKTLWDTWVADSGKGYFLSAAPVVYGGKVYMGEAGADWGANGHVRAFDAKTGKPLWSFDLIPTGNQPGSSTWKKGSQHGGGSVWTTLTVDPVSKMIYTSVGNPAPDYNGVQRPGDNLYTDSVVALDANTGKLNWYTQQVAHDTHDWDTAAAPILYDQNGQKFMAVATKGGWLYIYDRATHKLIQKAEISSHENADIPASTTPHHACPGTIGGAEWNGPSIDPVNKTIYVDSVEWCGTVQLGEARYIEGGGYFGGTFSQDPLSKASGWLRAFEAGTGKQLWATRMPTPMVAGVTPTAGGVVLTGDQNGNFLVVNAKDGKTVYKFNTGGAVGGGVSTYAVNGKQYVAVASGNASRGIWKTTGAATIVVFGMKE
ncbi:PQQ-binding-like beta-propeller repeat protein (plasmid) [Deinococcus sp. KNUC1210]|uniref:outer membrane protein assembly factor BamB family protein n=1 Tax=Deinococcus sp. KNUC1210 TaxID=2917691 RepID=UPI001EF11C3B|nr:PQQ-binding-like beta-propeller repeat protein [Deinococcus sp. KNUC1210]ULH13889.1 PQQ-binding-like beta-propeller repeat protein [Deinococcus sp. KNUC1210]